VNPDPTPADRAFAHNGVPCEVHDICADEPGCIIDPDPTPADARLAIAVGDAICQSIWVFTKNDEPIEVDEAGLFGDITRALAAAGFHIVKPGQLEALEARLAEVDEYLPGIMACAANYDARLGVMGSASLPKWMFDLITPEDQARMEERPIAAMKRIAATRGMAVVKPGQAVGADGTVCDLEEPEAWERDLVVWRLRPVAGGTHE
jgi:hypothetical protein